MLLYAKHAQNRPATAGHSHVADIPGVCANEPLTAHHRGECAVRSPERRPSPSKHSGIS